MAKLTTNHNKLYFDTLCRTKKAESVLSLIHATYQAWNDKNISDKKADIAKRLQYAYNLFKGTEGSYSGSISQFESQYTIGHELCIWKNSQLQLTDLAMKVAENKITIRDYFDIVFLNYFQPINNCTVHILYHLLSYLKENNTTEISKDDLGAVYMKVGSAVEKGEVNGAFNMLLSSNYFITVDNKTLKYVGADSIEQLINKCDTTYVERGYEAALEDLSEESAYIKYLLDDHRDKDCYEQDNYEDVLKHNLFGIHMKMRNDALSSTDPHISIGWSILGDLTSIDTYEELSDLYDRYIQKTPRGRGQDIGQIWRFLKEAKDGDYVIFSNENVCHIGRIKSDYLFETNESPLEDPDYCNRRKVRWLKENIKRSDLSTAFHRSLATGMSFWGLNDYKSSVVELLKGTYVKDIVEDIEDDEVIGLQSQDLEFESSFDCNIPRNRILFGAPGTGKSYTLNKEIDKLIKDYDGEFERVTFHPDYSYANFVGTYKPVPTNEGITYEYVPGPFMRILTKALKNINSQEEPKPFILVIEEINRANVAAVFGEVFQLLDRDEHQSSEYEINVSEDVKKHLAKVLECKIENVTKIKIPNNMFIWATMNSADQGVFPMDTAFKRRWDFTYLGIDNGDKNISEKTVSIGSGDNQRTVEWNSLRKAINKVLSSKEFKVNEDKLMGPYFLSTKVIPLVGNVDEEKFKEAFKNKVIMYLFEDAAKQKKHTLFSGCADTTRYSSICKEFDSKGIFIFCKDVLKELTIIEGEEGEN